MHLELVSNHTHIVIKSLCFWVNPILAPGRFKCEFFLRSKNTVGSGINYFSSVAARTPLCNNEWSCQPSHKLSKHKNAVLKQKNNPLTDRLRVLVQVVVVKERVLLEMFERLLRKCQANLGRYFTSRLNGWRGRDCPVLTRPVNETARGWDQICCCPIRGMYLTKTCFLALRGKQRPTH